MTSARWPPGSRSREGPVTARLRRAMRIGAMLIAVLATSTPLALAQERNPAADDERDRAFVEALRREDPADAARYTELRDARRSAIAELQKVQARYGAAGPELRPVLLPQLKEAQRRYAEGSLAVLDFLDARDRRALARYEEEIGRIKALLDEHVRTRADLEKLRRGE